MKKTIIGAVAVLLLLLLPFAIWWFQGSERLKVAIIDKTVPSENYREHKGLTWVLNHNRYVKEDETGYRAADDYFGFMPNETEKDYEIRGVEELGSGHDLIYLADAYGVYEDDLPWQEQKGQRSELIYGGLEMAEWQMIKQQVMDASSDLVVEFNTFASPTDAAVSTDMEEFLGIKWSGWSGRYFPDLSAGAEVPEWIIENYERDAEDWPFTGGGFVLVEDESGEIVVLSEERGDIESAGLHVKFTDSGQTAFDLKESPSFDYWFDINEAQGQTEVLAEYEWSLGEQGQAVLSDRGIPSDFPAIMRKPVNESEVYYFAGDFVDIEDVPSLYQYGGLAKMRQYMPFNGNDSFYWKTYVPMMEKILADSSSKEQETQSQVSTAAEKDGISYPSRVNGEQFEVFEGGEWKNFTVKGVNMGMAKPGTFLAKQRSHGRNTTAGSRRSAK